ncbi:uncharacterized protein LOC112528553 [Cynara cardunculus var. scolymus]|uniref:uncharacterized protein LOC112528553 n=1 Tax=Cynara cardunculus var. scolymus TaxID=59895 RepID=UPI000D62F11F|nr:uncharacterized protein LOC112528553 [Cynara cardunculus var. scolymus]
MKLPVDLSGQMPGNLDQLAKWGSMTFMCTMMSNLMPSLASMDNRELFANVTGRRAYLDFGSDYEWSIVVIVIIQVIGILVGIIAPVFRCFAALSFRLSLKWVKKHTKVCEVEKYWTQKLLEWKQIPLAFPLSGRISKALVYNLYHLILNLGITCQKVIVVSCKIIGLIPLVTVIIGVFCVNCCKSLKANFFLMPVASNRETEHAFEQNHDTNQDIENYVLQLQDEMELGRRTLKRFSNSANRSIKKGEKQLPTNLLKLIEQCTGFEGVVKFDSENIQGLIWVTFPNSWSLPIVTLTCIAITLPNISQESVDNLFKGVSESLSYTLLVEESLNNVGEYKKIHKATMELRQEVEVNYKWLGNTLQRNAYKEKNPKEILEWFADKAKDIAVEMNEHINEEPFDSYCDRLVVADSMYRVTQTIMVNYPDDIEDGRGEQLFYLLSSMIVDIAVACFTNLPRVIVMKCQDDAIEKREASVRAAAELLGSTKTIIEKVDACEVPNLDPEQMAFIDEWRLHLKQSIP